MPPDILTGVEEGYIEKEKAGEKVLARKKGFGSGQGEGRGWEYIGVVFMSLGRWSWKGATGNDLTIYSVGNKCALYRFLCVLE